MLTSFALELADSGQISECYKNNDMAFLLAMMVIMVLSCPMENIPRFGSTHLNDFSLMRVFGNGIAEEIFERCFS